MTHTAPQIHTVPLVELFDPLIHEPPVGATLLVINPGGVLTKSTWYEGALAWGYLPKIPQTVKDRMSPPRTRA